MNLQTNKELNFVEKEIAEKTAQEWENYPVNMGEQHLKAIKLILDKDWTMDINHFRFWFYKDIQKTRTKLS